MRRDIDGLSVILADMRARIAVCGDDVSRVDECHMPDRPTKYYTRSDLSDDVVDMGRILPNKRLIESQSSYASLISALKAYKASRLIDIDGQISDAKVEICDSR